MRYRTQAGFTLIELIMVIVIMGILMVVALPKFTTLNSETREAQIQRTLALLRVGHHSIKHQWHLAGAQTGTVTLTLDGVDVVFIDGGASDTGDSNHVPSELTFQRNEAQTRLFFLFLEDSVVSDVIASSDNGPGWAMLGTNGSCAAGTDPRRCWAFRDGGQQIARITYMVDTGEFVRD